MSDNKDMFTRENDKEFNDFMDFLFAPFVSYSHYDPTITKNNIEKIKNNNPIFSRDVVRKPDGYVIEIDVPGFEDDEVVVEAVEEKTIEISAVKKEESTRRDIRRTYSFDDWDTTKATRSLKNGVLTVKVPFVEKVEPQRRIIPND